MDNKLDSETTFFIDTNPFVERNRELKRKLSNTNKSKDYNRKKRRYNADSPTKCVYENEKEKSHENMKKAKKKHVSSDSGITKSSLVYKNEKGNSQEDMKNAKKENFSSDSEIKASVVYYENILKDFKKGINSEVKDAVVSNSLGESEGKEVELACHSLVSHCMEMLLTECKDTSIILRFMSAFAENKITVCTSANASHLTELLMHRAVKGLQNWSSIMASEDDKEQTFIVYYINWLVEFGNFAVENLADCLQSQHSCHVVCTLIGALSGDLAENNKLMSKNLKDHKKEFRSQFTDMDSSTKNQDSSLVVLDQIPKNFSLMLKVLYKALVQLENIADFINDSSAATVIEALIVALKKRHPKACRKMISKLAKRMFLKRNKDDVPVCLLHKNASFVFDEMFKAADENLQIALCNEYISDHIEKLVVDSVGNYVIQRLYDAINNRILFETACKHIWSAFDQIVKYQNYGIFVSMSTACNRLGTQQAFFMENIMHCLQCYEPVERQDLIIPLLLGFQKYDDYAGKKSESHIKICLQGSLVVQAILKFHKPLKAVKSILNMAPEYIDFLAGHIQGCHVLNAFFGSVTVGEKNKEKLLHHLQPVLVSMALDRNKSLTLSRIWTSLSLKLKEIIARQFAQNQPTLKSTKSGYAVFQKFGISRFRKFEEWKQMQSSISSIKKPQKH